MTDIEIVKYKKGDILDIPGYAAEICPEKLDTMFMGGEAFTGMAEGKIAFCCGLVFYWPGHAEVWLIMGKPANKYIAAFSKIKDLLGWMVAKHNLFRATAHCDANWKEANRLIEHLGFSFEAKLNSYGPLREAYNVYGKIWPA
jgi:hypothetical protein